MLHELMHADVITFERNNDRHVTDAYFDLQDSNSRDKSVWAYHPLMTKLLAKYWPFEDERYDPGRYTLRNGILYISRLSWTI